MGLGPSQRTIQIHGEHVTVLRGERRLVLGRNQGTPPASPRAVPPSPPAGVPQRSLARQATEPGIILPSHFNLRAGGEQGHVRVHVWREREHESNTEHRQSVE